MSKDLTLKGWRELRGLTREELAERIGVTASMVARWEEIGLDGEPNSRYGDRLASLLMDALDIDGSLRIEHVPSEPKPGDIVVTPAEAGIGPADLLDMVADSAEQDAVRMAVPNGHDLSLKPLGDLDEGDWARPAEHHRGEMAYSMAMARRMGNALELLGGNSGEWKPGQTVAERLEEMGRSIGAGPPVEGDGG